MIRESVTILMMVSIFLLGTTKPYSICLANRAFSENELREPEPEQLKQEINNLSQVREEFLLLKNAGKIPNIKPDETGWSGDVAKVTPRYVSLSKGFNAEQFKQELVICNDLYRAELTHSATKRKIMGFICLTSNKVNLLSIYELKDKTWVKTTQ